MSPAVDTLERLIVQKRVRHGNHPVLAWNAVNALVTRDPAGGRKLDKSNRDDQSRARNRRAGVDRIKARPSRFSLERKFLHGKFCIVLLNTQCEEVPMK